MDNARLSEMANLFLALSDKTRLRIVGMMRNCEVSVGEFSQALGDSQPKISRHLAYLRSMGIVSARRDGKWVYYRIDTSANPGVEAILQAVLDQVSPPAEGRPAEIAAHAREDAAEPPTWHPENPTQGEIDIFLL